MAQILWLSIGIVAAAAFLFYARSLSPKREEAALGIGLLVAAIIYVGFALLWGDGAWVLVELIGVLLYGLFYWLSRRYTFYWLAVGWSAHVLWDVGLHLIGAGHAIAPEWYVYACLSFDLSVAAYIVYRVATDRRSKNLRKCFGHTQQDSMQSAVLFL